MTIPHLFEAVRDLATVRRLLPMWTDWGITDASCSIHSLGISFLTLLGQELGYVSISEFPIPRQGEYAEIGDDVRCDSIWFDRQTRTPVAIAEFERYSGLEDRKKLAGKVKNLLLAHHRMADRPRWLILAYWTEGLVSLPNHSQFHQIVKQGFETSDRLRINGTQQGHLLCLQFVHETNPHQLLQLTQIFPRGVDEFSQSLLYS